LQNGRGETNWASGVCGHPIPQGGERRGKEGGVCLRHGKKGNGQNGRSCEKGGFDNSAAKHTHCAMILWGKKEKAKKGERGHQSVRKKTVQSGKGKSSGGGKKCLDRQKFFRFKKGPPRLASQGGLEDSWFRSRTKRKRPGNLGGDLGNLAPRDVFGSRGVLDVLD